MANTLVQERGHLVLPVSVRITESCWSSRYFVSAYVAGTFVAEHENGLVDLGTAKRQAECMYDHWIDVIGRVWALAQEAKT
jgi:hypothetical protein